MSFRFPFQITRTFKQCRPTYTIRTLHKLNYFKFTGLDTTAKFQKRQFNSVSKSTPEEISCQKSKNVPKKLELTPKTFPTCLQKRSYNTDDEAERNREKVRDENECDLKEPEVKLAFRTTAKEECKEYAGVVEPNECPEIKRLEKRYDTRKMKWPHKCKDEYRPEDTPRMDQTRGYKIKPKKLKPLDSLDGCKKVEEKIELESPELKPLKKKYDISKMKWKHSYCPEDDAKNRPKRMDEERGYKIEPKKLEKLEPTPCENNLPPEKLEEGPSLKPPKKKYHISSMKWPCVPKDDKDKCNYDPPRMDDVRCWKPIRKKLPLFNDDKEEREFFKGVTDLPITKHISNVNPGHFSVIKSGQMLKKVTQMNFSTAAYYSIAQKLNTSGLCIARYYSKSKSEKPKCGADKPECKKDKKKQKCPKFTLPGCKPPARSDCYHKTEPKKPCQKVEAPYPSFTDSNPQLPEKKITECQMAEINRKRFKAKVSGEVDEEDLAKRRREEECKKLQKEPRCILGHPEKVPKGCEDISKKPKKKTSSETCTCGTSDKSSSKKEKDTCKKPTKKAKVCEEKCAKKDTCTKPCEPKVLCEEQKPKCAKVCEEKFTVPNKCEMKDPCEEKCTKKAVCSSVCEKKEPPCPTPCKEEPKCAPACKMEDPCASSCKKEDPCAAVCKKADPCAPACAKPDPCSSKKLVCSSSSPSASSTVLTKGSKLCRTSQEEKKSTCASNVSAASRTMASCPCDCGDPPKPKKPSIFKRIFNYFRARPNCPAPDDWKKKKLRDKAYKAAAAAGLEICDPKEACEDPCKVLNKTKPNPCDPIPKSCCQGKKKKSWSICNCFTSGKKSRCYSTIARRDFGTYMHVLEEIASERRREDLLFERLKGFNNMKCLLDNFSAIHFPFLKSISRFVPRENDVVDTYQNKHILPACRKKQFLESTLL